MNDFDVYIDDGQSVATCNGQALVITSELPVEVEAETTQQVDVESTIPLVIEVNTGGLPGPPGPSAPMKSPYTALVGDGVSTVFRIPAVVHGQGPLEAIKVRVLNVVTGDEWLTYHEVQNNGDVLVAFTNPPGLSQFQIIIEG